MTIKHLLLTIKHKLWLFNHKKADFWLPNFGLKDHFSASLNEVSISPGIKYGNDDDGDDDDGGDDDDDATLDLFYREKTCSLSCNCFIRNEPSSLYDFVNFLVNCTSYH